MKYSRLLSAPRIFILLTTALTAVSAQARAPQPYPAPPDSYLQQPVYSVNELVRQVQDNPVVRARYAHHFVHMPPGQLAQWMRRNLVESWVPKTRTYVVYCVSPSGKFYAVRQKFTRGTKVFALRDGTPLMKWICGNPLFNAETQKLSPSKQVTTKTLASTSELTEAMQENIIPVGSAIQPLAIPAFGPSAFSTAGVVGSLATAASALPLLGLFSNSGGGGGGSAVVVVHQAPAVPEPSASLLVLCALPIAAGAAFCRRRGTSGS